ncbi:hypothetical protein scyTo_0018465 [Scyliorhinus torazame]|uniref:MANSC domain-containing protein n=1 Tax=Scyliorhinus torazame TaxID=75743 RepID=A0A401PW98_SCYTO|nr:hypothetical protein [Scyliorhinus torazame]
MIWHHSESFLLLLLTILTNHKSLLQESDCTGSDTGIMDAIIDVKVALTKGMVSLAPFHTDTVEECHDECCSDLPVTGEHLCNFITFNPRKKSSYQNCYLFYCPDKDACPLMESKGYISHFIHRELKNIRDESTEETYFHRGEESSDDGIAPDLLNKLTFNPTQITSHHGVWMKSKLYKLENIGA